MRVVYLHGEKAVIAARLAERKGHFMPRSLLDSQFAVLEEPDPDEESIRLKTDRLVGDIVAEIVHELNPPTESRSPVIPQIKPNLKQPSATVGARPSARATTSLRSDLPLAIEDYALIGDCITAALVGQRLHRLAVLAAFRQQRFLRLYWAHRNMDVGRSAPIQAPQVEPVFRDGTMVLETVFETADGRVALIDFRPVGRSNSSLIRVVHGQRGKVAMRLHLALRFVTARQCRG